MSGCSPQRIDERSPQCETISDACHSCREESAKFVAQNCCLPNCKPADSDQIIQLQLRASAFPRGLELLLHKAGIVFLALGLERLLQSEQRTWVARVPF